MSLNSITVDHFSLYRLLCLLMMVFVSSVHSNQVVRVPVTVFGDGNPLNGVEDSREQLAGKRYRRGDHNGQNMYAGTIHCDGRMRGTAMVVDTREVSPDLKGVVLITAAHVLYDLKTDNLFRRCKFSFMGWEKVAGFRSKIDLKKIRMGGFNPSRATEELAFGEGDWAYLYLPKPWRKFDPEQSVQLREFSFSRVESYQQAGGEFRLVAFDSEVGAISQSRNCAVIESKRDDLGGGSWKGQLLDDCDSADGASGGGIIAIMNKQHFLVGVRGGSHWSDDFYPQDEFPSGPPDGSVWNLRSNTNFGRAIDSKLFSEMILFTNSLEK